MKVLLYSEKQKTFKKSGIGHALLQQKEALEQNGVEVTFNKNDRYDIVHINTLFKKSYRLTKRLDKEKIPYVVHGHSTKEDFLNSFKFSNTFLYKWFNFNLLRMYKKAKYIITPTEYSKSLIDAYAGVNAKVYAISNGINLAKYKEETMYNEQEVEAFYRFLNLKKEDKFVIGMGFYFVRKGLVDFIEVAKKFPSIKFIWFGKRYPFITSSPIMKAIKRKPKNVILPGYIDMHYKKIAFSKASLFFFPSCEETEGIVVLESLASKLPLLVRDIGVYKGWLVKDQNCHMASNNEGFEHEINRILNEDQSKIVDAGYEFIKSRDLKLVGAQLKKVYEEILFENKK